METPNLPRDNDGALVAYAWPGGYPVAYLDAEGATLCADCANEEERWDGHSIRAAMVHWEGPPMACDECCGEIPSAYGDPWEATS